MSKKNFDIYDYVHNNKFELKVESKKETNVFKGYNDIRKTNINEVKIVDGKFSLSESIEANRPLTNEVKKIFEDCSQQLDTIKKDILFMSYIKGITTKEISDIIEKPQNTILTWLANAKKQMIECIEG